MHTSKNLCLVDTVFFNDSFTGQTTWSQWRRHSPTHKSCDKTTLTMTHRAETQHVTRRQLPTCKGHCKKSSKPLANSVTGSGGSWVYQHTRTHTRNNQSVIHVVLEDAWLLLVSGMDGILLKAFFFYTQNVQGGFISRTKGSDPVKCKGPGDDTHDVDCTDNVTLQRTVPIWGSTRQYSSDKIFILRPFWRPLWRWNLSPKNWCWWLWMLQDGDIFKAFQNLALDKLELRKMTKIVKRLVSVLKHFRHHQ